MTVIGGIIAVLYFLYRQNSVVMTNQRFPQNLNQTLLLRRPQMADISIKDKDDAPDNQHRLIISDPNLPADERPQKTKRLASLDIFRGLTVAVTPFSLSLCAFCMLCVTGSRSCSLCNRCRLTDTGRSRGRRTGLLNCPCWFPKITTILYSMTMGFHNFNSLYINFQAFIFHLFFEEKFLNIISFIK